MRAFGTPWGVVLPGGWFGLLGMFTLLRLNWYWLVDYLVDVAEVRRSPAEGGQAGRVHHDLPGPPSQGGERIMDGSMVDCVDSCMLVILRGFGVYLWIHI